MRLARTQSTITPGVHLTFKIAGLKREIAVSKVLENLDKPDKTVSTSFRIAVINQYGEQNCVTTDKSV